MDIKSRKMKYILFSACFGILACNHPSCDTMPSKFNSYEDAISFVKDAVFKREDEIKTDKGSWIKGAHYYSCDESVGYVIIQSDKGEYLLRGVPDSIWENFKYADSYVSYYNYNIKGKYTFVLDNSRQSNRIAGSFTDTITMLQKRLDEIVGNYYSGYPSAPNESEKQLLIENPVQYLKNEIKDSLYLKEFKVKVISISYEKEKEHILAHALFDDGKLAYACYARFKNEEQMMNDPTFKFINGFKENSDTVINFMYTQKIVLSQNRFVLTIVPMPRTGVDYIESSYTNDSHVNISPWIK